MEEIMKKFLMIIFILGLVLSFTACGKGNSGSGDDGEDEAEINFGDL